jgi:nitrogen fixation protein NifQ
VFDSSGVMAMQSVAQNIEDRISATEIYERLMLKSHGLRNDRILASMLASQLAGDGSMPPRLGLNTFDYENMMRLHFPGAELPLSYMAEVAVETQRYPEQDELRALLLAHRADPSQEAEWMAQIVVIGCMGGDHLWQDLGLWSRKDLTLLMQQNFTQLAAKNDRDMKWKKFLYKQLCLAEGIYVCRSPSCEVCPDYAACFGPEE